MQSYVESGVSTVLMQKEELKEGIIQAAKSFCLEILHSVLYLNIKSSVEHLPVFWSTRYSTAEEVQLCNSLMPTYFPSLK